MDKLNNNNFNNSDNNSSSKVRNIDELLAAKRANVQLGSSRATETIEGATNAVRINAGKAKRSELRNNLIKTAELAQVQGEEEGIKQFLAEDIPAVIEALNSGIRSSHMKALETNEVRLLEEGVVDAQWEEITYSFDMSFDDYDLPQLTSSSAVNPQLTGSIQTSEENPYSID